MRSGLASLLFAAALVAAAPAGPLRPISSPVPLDERDDSRDDVGQLRYLGGVHLTSPQPEFGGISGLRALPDGRLLAITDAGHWLVLTPEETDGRLTGVSAMALAPILDGNGQPLAGKAMADAEALDLTADGVLVAFERRNAVIRYSGSIENPGALRPAGALALKGAETLPENGGIEAFAATGADSFVAISEEGIGPGSSYLAWRGTPQGSFTFGYEPPAGFVATDMVAVDGSSVLVLNRRFSLLGGVAAALVRLPLAAIRPGVLVTGETIAEFAPPLTVDNMEGLAIRREGGRTVLYLISDDNFSRMQRTLLLKFAWPDAP